MTTATCDGLTREHKDTLNSLVHARRALRAFFASIDRNHDHGRNAARQIKKLRATGNRFDARRADLLEQDQDFVQQISRQELESMQIYIRDIGRILMHYPATCFPQALLLDFLEVNQVDRQQVEPDDGLVELVYLHGLEQSACYRGDDSSQGPFARAIVSYLQHELIHNKEMKKQADALLFGKGGMFEFIPTYKQNAQGEMVRQQPPLRLA